MISSRPVEESEIAAGLWTAVDGVSPRAEVWAKIESRTTPGSMWRTTRPWLSMRAVPLYALAAVIALTAFLVPGMLTNAGPDDDTGETASAATVGDETFPVVPLGDSLFTGEVLLTGDVVELVQTGNGGAVVLDQVSQGSLSAAQALLDGALGKLADTEFRVSSLQTSGKIEKSMVFDGIIRNYYDGGDLHIYRILDERDCVTTPIDVPGAGVKTICKFYAKEDGVEVGESYAMPIYRVTEANYSPDSEVLVRIDNRTSTPIPSINRSTVYHGDVQLWRLVEGATEYRTALSVGNFELVGGRDWRPLDVSVEPGTATVEWLLARQMPEWNWTPVEGTDRRSGFVPGANYRAETFESVEILPTNEEGRITIEATRSLGYSDHYETVLIELDAESGLPLRITVGIEEFVPSVVSTDYSFPIEFLFEYPE